MPKLSPQLLLLVCLSLSTAAVQKCAQGNWNPDTESCECPWGYGGKHCSEDLLPACRLLLPPATNSSVSCEEEPPKSCACLRQCWKLQCGIQELGSRDQCEKHMDAHARCFERAGLPDEQQISNPPGLNDPQTRYYRGIFPGDPSRKRLTSEEDTKALPHLANMILVPNSRCPQACSQHGQCAAPRSAASKATTTCLCHFGYEGAGCERSVPSACYSGCNGKGICLGGFCQCEEGWWGIDCSRSKSFVRKPAGEVLPPVTRARVFMYDLPPSLARDLMNHDPNYISYKRFIAAFLKDWTVRTENPWEANLFFIPALLYYYSSNLGVAASHLKRVVSHVQQDFPFWNRTRGADHFFFATQDRGLCHYRMDGVLQDSIRLVHFGFYQPNTTHHLLGTPVGNCFNPLRDVVVASNLAGAMNMVKKTYGGKLGLEGASPDPPANRTKLVFMAGGVRLEDPSYSGGTRQWLWSLYNDTNSSDPDITYYQGGVPDYELQLRTHKFCLAPWGHGYGIRLPHVMFMGCVPVIMQEYVYQTFEDVLPYQDFSVRLSNDDIPRLGDTLRAIDDDEYERLQLGLLRNVRALYWDEDEGPLGGQAYNLTIHSLMKRYRYRKGKLQTAPRQCIVPPDTLPPPSPPLDCPEPPPPPPVECPEHPPPPTCPKAPPPSPQRECPKPPPSQPPKACPASKCPPPPQCPAAEKLQRFPDTKAIKSISQIHTTARDFQTRLVYLLCLVLAFAAGLSVSAAGGWLTQGRRTSRHEEHRTFLPQAQ